MLTSIITWIIVGGIAGFLAEWLIGGIHTGCIGTVIRVVGALIGGWLFGPAAHCGRRRTAERYCHCIRRPCCFWSSGFSGHGVLAAAGSLPGRLQPRAANRSGATLLS